MRCHKAEHHISLKLDNELKPNQDLKLQKHLQRCASCKKMYQDYQRIQTGLQNIPNPEFPPQLHHLVMTALPGRNRKAELHKMRLSLATAALSIVLSITAGTYVGYQGYSSTQSYTQTLTEEVSSDGLFGENSLMAVSYDE
jgi:predicted anti-sigma-YlaC factor YlaD